MSCSFFRWRIPGIWLAVFFLVSSFRVNAGEHGRLKYGNFQNFPLITLQKKRDLLLEKRQKGRAFYPEGSFFKNRESFSSFKPASAFSLAEDPFLEWSTYLGGTDEDVAYFNSEVAVDPSGNVYVTGTTGSTDFPVPNGWDTSHNGGYLDAFVSKFSSKGELLWSTFLGGIEMDIGYDVAVDAAGNVYVTGWTLSDDFPVPNGWDTSYNGVYMFNVFVSKFSADGSQLLWSTYLGGTDDNLSCAIELDGDGNVYIGGSTLSDNFPVPNGWDKTHNGKIARRGNHRKFNHGYRQENKRP